MKNRILRVVRYGATALLLVCVAAATISALINRTLPTRSQVVVYTVVVVAVSIITAAYLGIWDYVFGSFIRHVI